MDSDLKTELLECLQVIDTCLDACYEGKSHMYRPLAGQLRILWCDRVGGKDISLFPQIKPKFAIAPLEPVHWSEKGAGNLLMVSEGASTSRMAAMPFEVISFNNGLTIANFIYHDSEKQILPSEWVDQCIMCFPTPVTARNVIRAIADKGGGSHVDNTPTRELNLLRKRKATPKHTYAELLTIALGRLSLGLGEELFGFSGISAYKIPNEEAIGHRLLWAVHAGLAKAIDLSIRKQQEKVSKPNSAAAYRGNVKSNKFHKPTCLYFKSKNCTVKFSNRRESIAAGYSPCGFCKP